MDKTRCPSEQKGSRGADSSEHRELLEMSCRCLLQGSCGLGYRKGELCKGPCRFADRIGAGLGRKQRRCGEDMLGGLEDSLRAIRGEVGPVGTGA